MTTSPRFILISLLSFVLIGGVINVPLAVTRLHSRLAPRPPHTLFASDIEAAAYGWPGPTPHTKPWPKPGQVQVYESWGYKHTQAWGPDEPGNNNRHSMYVKLMGWPLPVLHEQKSWWPFDHPDWQTSAEPDPAMKLVWSGMLINPILLGIGA